MNGAIRVVLLAAFLFFATAGSHASYGTPQRVQQWRVVEITLASRLPHTDPFRDVDVTATFTSPKMTITRPAFWDGGNTWKIRFAPPVTGAWTYVTHASDSADKGLDGCTGRIEAAPYNGDLAIYKHGFVTVSPNHRYFTYADGTPFFYLGDTHWFAMRERFSSSNLPGAVSQFRHEVDRRVEQGFTVYQSEWMSVTRGKPAATLEEPGYDWADGITENDLPGFRNVDRKFAYLADRGLVVANAMAWRGSILGYDDEYIRRLARNWSARYGAYPVLWTMAQEVDGSYPKDQPGLDAKWQTMAEALSASDDYHHPLSAHMCNQTAAVASNSLWRDKPYHTWYAAQIQGGPLWASCARDFWEAQPTKPAILYEPQYENFWTTESGERHQGYAAFLSGFYGFGYGVAGIWDDSYSCDPPDRGTIYDKNCHVWYEELERPSATQMTYLRRFFEAIDWWKLEPCYNIADRATLDEPKFARLAFSDRATVLLLYNATVKSGVLHRLKPGASYDASWYDPRRGAYILIGVVRADDGGNCAMPEKPDANDYLLRLLREK
ncbi:MAG: DUF5060 domain-containing protein [Capsulimonadaceae bacterium]|nr:DUF5060 domain-containing protein [Capsulimonadaceae bacterium]